jgi:succinyl-CoA synthetase beta subunit
MKLHEYQAKLIFSRHGIAVPRGIPCFDLASVAEAAKALIAETGDERVVVKAQIHAGGRGKGGGIRVVQGAAQAQRAAEGMLERPLVTHQTGPRGQLVRRVYVEQVLDIERELYLGLVVDREHGRIAVMASAEGGVDIEEVAATRPEAIHTIHVDPLLGLMPFQARELAYALGVADGSPDAKATTSAFVRTAVALAKLFETEDCTLCEVNPLVVTKQGAIVALDAKLVLDDNGAFRHPEWTALLDEDEEDPRELEAKRAGLSYVSLDGNIGCLVNGAGLAMATMDIIQHHGGSPANFLDVGGGASREQVTTAFKMILSSERVKGVFVNIFGGIMRCDVIAEGIVAATKELALDVPLVVRLEGTNVNEGKKILSDSGLRITPADSMADGARKIIEAVS